MRAPVCLRVLHRDGGRVSEKTGNQQSVDRKQEGTQKVGAISVRPGPQLRRNSAIRWQRVWALDRWVLGQWMSTEEEETKARTEWYSGW